MTENNPIIFYDGLCGLCNCSLQFIIKHDKKKKFRFAALQSDFAKQILGENILTDSVILFDNGTIYHQSTAALKVCKILGGYLNLLSIFILVPQKLRDRIYDWIAKNRYQWFGKFDMCKIPSADQKDYLFHE